MDPWIWIPWREEHRESDLVKAKAGIANSSCSRTDISKNACLATYLDFYVLLKTSSYLECAGYRSSAVVRFRFSPRQGFTTHDIHHLHS